MESDVSSNRFRRDLKAVLSRIEEHRSAGADHVCIQVLTEGQQKFPLSESRAIAVALQPA
jgi:hypothetical protein